MLVEPTRSLETPFLDVRGLVVVYSGVRVLDGVTFSLPANHVTFCLGGNGAGKSTLLSAIAGLAKTQAGSLLLQGRLVPSEHLAAARCRSGISLVPQAAFVYNDLTILENARVALAYVKDRRVRLHRCLQTFTQEFPELPIDTPVSALATGEARFLSILCGIHRATSILLLDEPSASLSRELTERVFALATAWAADGCDDAPRAVVIAEQDIAWAEKTRAGVIVLAHRQVVYAGPIDGAPKP
jgi:ABC-type branched-subunit amino acid transport system ATPase component